MGEFMNTQRLVKKLSKKLFVLAGLSLATTSFSFAVTLNNPGFENNFNGWDDIEPSSISSVERSGTKAAKISGSSGRISQNVNIDTNSDYLLTAYIRGSGTLGARVGGNNVTTNVSNSSGFQKAEVSFSSGSSSSVEIFGAYNNSEGRFDDFTLVKTSSAPPPPPPSGTACDSANAVSIANTIEAELHIFKMVIGQNML